MAVLQHAPAVFQHRHQGIIEKLRSGVAGRVREAIEQSAARILAGIVRPPSPFVRKSA